MATDLAKIAKERKIKYFLISYTDLFGVLRAKLVPAAAIGDMQKAGAGFAGFATWLDMTPADPDMFAIPDPNSLTRLPWQPEVAWLAGDLWMADKEVASAPRVVLKRQIEAAAQQGYRMKSGVECEYFIILPDGSAISDARDTQDKPCYDQSALMRRYEVITAICDAMLELGNFVASAVAAAAGDLAAPTGQVRSEGCQGVRPGVRPALVYTEGAPLLVARARMRLHAFDEFEAWLVLPALAALAA